MTLRSRVRLAWIAGAIALIVGAFALGRVLGSDPGKTALVLVFPVCAALVGYQVWLVRRAQRRLERAVESGDLPKLRQELSSVAEYFRSHPALRGQLESLARQMDQERQAPRPPDQQS